jgi:Holliday junction resolvasome RuvABC ATP-dependent DNA helicase subunit
VTKAKKTTRLTRKELPLSKRVTLATFLYCYQKSEILVTIKQSSLLMELQKFEE